MAIPMEAGKSAAQSEILAASFSSAFEKRMSPRTLTSYTHAAIERRTGTQNAIIKKWQKF